MGMNGFHDLTERAAWDERLPHMTRLAAAALEPRGGQESGESGGSLDSAPSHRRRYRAVVFAELLSDTVPDRVQVGARREVTVSCCLCPKTIRFPASGYGDMARKAQAVGWQYTPGHPQGERAWCPDCRPDAESGNR